MLPFFFVIRKTKLLTSSVKSISFNSVKVTEKIQNHTEWKGQPHSSRYTIWGVGLSLLKMNSAAPRPARPFLWGRSSIAISAVLCPSLLPTSEFLASPKLCAPGFPELWAYCLLLCILHGRLCRRCDAFTSQLQRTSGSWVCTLPKDRNCVWVTTDTGYHLPPKSLKMWWTNGLLLVWG